MYLGEHWEYHKYTRTRNGVAHELTRRHRVYELRCDSCQTVFMRTSKQLHAKHGSHCCGDCDQKAFAQKQSALIRRYNRIDASSSQTI